MKHQTRLTPQLKYLPFVFLRHSIAAVALCATCGLGFSASAERASAGEGQLDDQLASIEEKISVTKKEIGRLRDASYLPDLYFSLADLQEQKARTLYLLKLQKNPGKSVDKLDFTLEKRPKLEAIEIYQKIYGFFPKEKRRDLALFLTGLEQRDLGQFVEMMQTFKLLSTEFPQSDHFAEANIIVGDFLFEEKKDSAAAIEVYNRVVNRPLSAFTPLAFYRIGGCYLSQSAYDQAVRAFEQALATEALTNPAELPEVYHKIDVRREAVVALALPYVELYSQPRAAVQALPTPVEYFLTKAPDHFTYRKVLSRAGRRLIIKEKWREAADAFYNVLVLTTDFDTRFEALQRVYEAWKKGQSQVGLLGFVREIGVTVDLLQASLEEPILFNAQAVAQMLKAQKSKGIGADKSERAKIWPSPALAQIQFLEQLMRVFSTELQRKAKTSGSPADFEESAEAYRQYLNRFPKSPKSLDILYNLAEVLFKSDKLVLAGMQYELLSNDKRLSKRASVFKESAIESYTKALQDSEQLTALDRIRARRGLREVGEDWIRSNPRAPGAATAAFNIANSWYDERNLGRAIESFKKFIQKYPKDEHVRDAIFLVINSYSQLDDFKGLAQAGEQLIQQSSLSNDDRKSIRDAMARARSKQLQNTAGNFGTKEYAENLLSVASKYKGSALGVQALYEAFQSLKAKRDPELFEVGEALLDQHADSQYAKEVASSMASLALSTAFFDRAARYLSLFAEKYPGEPESLEFRKTSALLFERQGEFKQARSIYAKLNDRASVARMDFLSGDWSQLESSSVVSGLPQAKYWQALAIWRQHHYQDAVPLLKELARATPVGVENQIRETRDEAVHARFLLAQLLLQRFQSIHMKSADDQKSLEDKVKLAQSITNDLQTLVKAGSGRWVIASLYQIGQTQRDLGSFISDSPIPAGLSEVDRKSYIDELNKQAKAYSFEAQKIFSKCMEAAESNDLFTPFVDGCRAKGRKVIQEEDDQIKVVHQTGGVEPPRAKLIRKALIANSQDLKLLLELGEVYILADQPQTAVGIFRRALEIDKKNPRAIAAIGVALLDLGEFDAAYDSLTQALSLDATNAVAIWNLEGLYRRFGFKSKQNAMKAKMKGLQAPKLLHKFEKTSAASA